MFELLNEVEDRIGYAKYKRKPKDMTMTEVGFNAGLTCAQTIVGDLIKIEEREYIKWMEMQGASLETMQELCGSKDIERSV